MSGMFMKVPLTYALPIGLMAVGSVKEMIYPTPWQKITEVKIFHPPQQNPMESRTNLLRSKIVPLLRTPRQGLVCVCVVVVVVVVCVCVCVGGGV